MDRFDTFLFDLDGTLIDQFAAIHRSYIHMMAQMGLSPPSMTEVRAAVGGGLDEGMRHFVPEERVSDAVRIYREYFVRTMLDDVVLLPGARDLLQDLRGRGARLAVLTNKHGDSSRVICRHLGLDPFLDAVVGAHDTEWLKPQPELIDYVLHRIGGGARDALMVGDSPYDILAGHNAGLPAWCVTTGTHDAGALQAAGADRIFTNLVELQRALGRPLTEPTRA
jgi:phosphoglycolate phosphatase-like HAD superfamily hydrolase